MQDVFQKATQVLANVKAKRKETISFGCNENLDDFENENIQPPALKKPAFHASIPGWMYSDLLFVPAKFMEGNEPTKEELARKHALVEQWHTDIKQNNKKLRS